MFFLFALVADTSRDRARQGLTIYIFAVGIIRACRTVRRKHFPLRQTNFHRARHSPRPTPALSVPDVFMSFAYILYDDNDEIYIYILKAFADGEAVRHFFSCFGFYLFFFTPWLRFTRSEFIKRVSARYARAPEMVPPLPPEATPRLRDRRRNDVYTYGRGMTR